jgi:ATP-dependent DNA helicase RecG
VEGRKNSLFISNKVAKITKQKAIYSRNKGLDDDYYKNLILQAIRDNGSMSRRDITDLLWDKLPEILEDAQKSSKIANLLTALRKAEKIMKAPKKLWVLHK